MTSIANPFLRSFLLMATILGLLSVTGCNGCWRQESAKTEEEKKKEEENKVKRLPDVDSLPPQTMPGVLSDPILVSRRRNRAKDDPVQKAIDKMKSLSLERSYAKPGHWFDVRYQTIANNYDIKGTLETQSVSSATKPVEIPGTKFSVFTDRPAALSKGEWKTFETSMFIPPRSSTVGMTKFLCELKGPRGSYGGDSNIGSSKMMLPHQHHIVILTSKPDDFKFIELSPTVQLPRTGDEFSSERTVASYIVITSPVGLPPPLPRQPLNWTTIAYLIWDDLDPDTLGEDQQTALLDWLHFGGQLIISGPDSLERLESSFLGQYLPALAESSLNFDDSNFATLNENWSLPEKNMPGKRRDLVVNKKYPVLGIQMTPHKQATFIEGTGDLVVERQLGRGRITATAFSIKAPAIRSWRSFDSFFNGALLRRPSRRFSDSGELNRIFRFDWVNDDAHMNEPLLHSSLRLLSRDLSPVSGSRNESPVESVRANEPKLEPNGFGAMVEAPLPASDSNRRNLDDHWHYGGFDSDAISGIAGWNDASPVANTARETLIDAAGITPPSATLVLKLLAGYLLVLVPLNWIVFRLMGKVEWAWAAVPIIAIIGAVVVIRMASLDIGFTRSNTQVAVLELHADYERGHLTEYSALYTSLSTNYKVLLDNLGSQALPFPSSSRFTVHDEPPKQLRINRTNKNSLEDLQIMSSTTQLLHAEHVINVGGKLFLEKDENNNLVIQNQTKLDLSEVIVVGGNESNERLVARIPTLAAGAKAMLQFDLHQDATSVTKSIPVYFNPERYAMDLWKDAFGSKSDVAQSTLLGIPGVVEQADEYRTWFLRNNSGDVITRSNFLVAYQELNPVRNVTLGRIFDRIEKTLVLSPAQYRLYAATDQAIGNTAVIPDSTQVDRQTLIVAHLTPPSLASPARDVNSPADFGNETSLDRDLRILDGEPQEEPPSAENTSESKVEK